MSRERLDCIIGTSKAEDLTRFDAAPESMKGGSRAGLAWPQTQDTLVALLRRKDMYRVRTERALPPRVAEQCLFVSRLRQDKEVKTTQGKLEKLEERYVKAHWEKCSSESSFFRIISRLLAGPTQ